MAQSKPKRRKKQKTATKFNFEKAIMANKKRLCELCKAVGSNITEHLQNSDYLQIYIATYQFCTVKKHPDYDIAPNLVSQIKESFRTMMYSERYNTIKPSDIKISVVDLHLIEGLLVYIERYLETDEERRKELEKGHAYLVEYFGDRLTHLTVKNNSLESLHKLCYIPTKPIFYVDEEADNNIMEKKFAVTSTFYIKKREAEKEFVCINKKSRWVYKLQQPSEITKEGKMTVNDCYIKSSFFEHLYKGTQTMLPVFIQLHAMDRIWLRLYPYETMLINMAIFDSLMENVKLRIYKNRILLEVHMGSLKVGYFVCDIVDEKLIIKTFLLLSNSDTPEGNKFKELTGFSKQDVSYWDFDCLPTFINNSMDKKNPLYLFFEEANLLDLFKLTPAYFDSQKYDYTTEIDWDKLNKYLNQTPDGQELSEEELECVDFTQMLR